MFIVHAVLVFDFLVSWVWSCWFYFVSWLPESLPVSASCLKFWIVCWTCWTPSKHQHAPIGFHSTVASCHVSSFPYLPSRYVFGKGFMLQCSLYFSGQEGISEPHKVTWFISLLTGNVLIQLSGPREGSILFYDCFMKPFQWVLDHSPEEKEIRKQLLAITQYQPSAADPSLEFCTFRQGVNRTNWHSRWHSTQVWTWKWVMNSPAAMTLHLWGHWLICHPLRQSSKQSPEIQFGMDFPT